MFIADWLDVLFVHYRIAPEHLAPLVPLELDLFDGDAYVSLVAFTQSRLRPTVGGRLGEMLAWPLAHHEFLNVRTYVRRGDVRGIFFLAEWIPNRLAAFVGPRTYGLPYRLGELRYDGMSREIEAAGRRLTIEAKTDMGGPPTLRVGDQLDDFLLERYTAFTCRQQIIRRFDVQHLPWPRRRVDVKLIDTSLLESRGGGWVDHAQFVCAHYSPGVRDVIIAPPRRVPRALLRRLVHG
jgi:uncharacterized protein YqjF (DUF2071 family)